ncbi:molybdopterin molybdotransferase MoeA [Pseudolysinimonas kribbensis]|uniref:Molybdopterin molybdenumtransferase n=1 Tax=Pseudolysinimonas kribbensis TaxID=433641 RepID=A0ABQ6K7X6_9MICO|nr:gephyrin-like molybdotransferase Glp [Pseudolysinimonas kribbensis]GMA95065.1 molybdopterin molybdenumtransferase [Pseudolysinimonas kribbensis]
MPQDSAPLRPLDDQIARVLGLATPLPIVRMPLAEAAGRTLAAPAVAAVDLPLFDSAAMDGYAVRAADVSITPVTLRVVADIPAGSALDPELPPRCAVRIMTGAAVPGGADTVVPFEQTEGGRAAGRGSLPASVTVLAATAGAHVRHRGEDVRPGDSVLPAGVELGARRLSTAAAAGIAEVDVRPAPRVAVISTGSELAAPGAALGRGRVPESNSLLIAGLVREAGAHPVLVATVADRVEGLQRTLADARAAGADLVVTTGGVSAGAYEVVRDALAAELEFVEVAMQPGRPQASGRLPGGPLVVSLPGTPTAAAVVFELVVRPALLALQGRAALHRPRLRMPVDARYRRRPGRTGYRPVAIDRDDPAAWIARDTASAVSRSGPHSVTGLGSADGLAVIPAGEGAIEPGDAVEVVLLG